jgi:hypothetical protein
MAVVGNKITIGKLGSENRIRRGSMSAIFSEGLLTIIGEV